MPSLKREEFPPRALGRLPPPQPSRCSRCETGTLVRAYGASEPEPHPHVTLYVCDTCGWSFASVC
jgi:hypothetical protein